VQTNKYFEDQEPIGFMQTTKDFIKEVLVILRKDPGQSIKKMATRLGLNRTYVAGYLDALESLGYVESKRIGPAKVYFNKKRRRKI